MIVQPIPAMNLDSKQETITYIGSLPLFTFFLRNVDGVEKFRASTRLLALKATLFGS